MQYYYESKPDMQNYHYINHKTGPFVVLHFHSAIELVIVRKGRMLATVNGEELIIEAGNGCFVNSFCMHSYLELEADTDVYALVGSRDFFDAVFADVGGIPCAKFKFGEFSLMNKIFERYKGSDDERVRRSIFRGAASLVLAVVAEENPILPVSSTSGTGEICDVLRYISENFADSLTLTSLSAKFGYSPQYFSKTFHRYMSVNLTEYINVARVNYAQKLLDANSAKSVAEAAFESGFSSLPSFYRAYKKVFGKLPRD